MTWLKSRLPSVGRLNKYRYHPLPTTPSRLSSASTSTSTNININPISSTKPLDTKDHETLLLQDGRTLGYAEYGSPTGYPLLYFHGFPSSRLEARTLYHLAQRKDLRIIAPDRPGFGLSSFLPHRRITDWPADVQALVNYVGVKEYAILGCSGGGPYALACADQLSKDTVSAIGIMAMRGPRQAGTKDVPRVSKFVTWMAKYVPKVLGALIMAVVRLLKSAHGRSRRDDVLQKQTGEAKLKWERAGQKPEETESVEESRNDKVNILLEAFAQGPEGFVHEALLLADDWGIDFENVGYDKVHIWHARNDKQSPVAMVRWLVERLPNAELEEFGDDEAFNITDHSQEILSILVPEEKTRGFEKGG